MTDSSFVHLHVHSEYSLLDGACRVDALCRRSAEDGVPGVALTDHGVMFGAVEFHDSAKKHGLVPIVGCEAYIAPRGRFDKTVRDEAHITLLAADDEGYKNLTALISKGFLEGYYYKPRIDMDLLAQHNRGLIVLSGCMSSLVASPLLKNDRAGSLKNAKAFHDIFGDRFYIELMRHGMPEEDVINTGLISVARELNLPLVATNDSHYLARGDAQAHDVLLCIGTGKTVADASRMKFFSDEFYVKSAAEMRELFADVPEACDNTLEIVKRIDLKIPEKIFYLPDYPVPSTAAADVAGVLAGAAAAAGLEAAPDRVVEMSADDYLRLVCERGLIERYGAERAATDPVLRERLEYELSVIVKMGFSSYFLIVWDFIKYARDCDIPVGPGRGSAVGSIVSYCLRITDLDPIKFKLIFERFLNPERISMPDIDTDFCVERRDEVIAYVTEKYGKDRVAQIVTFGTMAARAAVRDAGRALAIPLPDVDRVAKLIPSGPGGLTISAALEQIPELRALRDRDPQIRKLLDTANSIEGLARHASTHAAGVVISKNPLTDHVPLVKLGEGDVNTQYDMNMVERVGLLKFDFLGLRNLTVMKAASDEIRRTTKPDFDLATLPDDDARTYEMIGRGETLGMFQLESEGMKRVCIELKPSRLDDIIALVALYRPGPMEWIPQYIANKHGRATPKFLHPKLEAILADTYGIACLRAGTPIWYADGTTKPIEDVQAGDELLTFDEGIVRPAIAAKAWPSGKKRLRRITLSTGTVIECSEDHRFPTPAGDVFARDLLPGDSALFECGVLASKPAVAAASGTSGVARRFAEPRHRNAAIETRPVQIETRPVVIDAIEDAGIDDCYDIQMQDQSSPYYIANGVASHNCFQEQIMQIARDLAGFTMGEGDELRKVMGKKQKDKIPFYREKFLDGCQANGIEKRLAEQIFHFIEPFAGYGFNKSHAAAYGWISYQTAYLKANYPLQYFAALMSSVRDKTDKLVEYIEEAKKMGIPVLPPDVNESLVDFAVVGSQIRFGLAAVKGVGQGAVDAVLAARNAGGRFTDLFDFTKRVEPKAANRKVYEALIKCGALDGLPGNRAQLLDALDGALDAASREARDRELGQASLFGALAEEAPALAPALRHVAAPTTMEALAWEKETLGIFVSGHPLADVADALARTGATPIKDLRGVEDDAPVRIAGLVTTVRRTLTKAQAQMLIATIEDMSGSIECVVFPKSYAQLQGAFVEDEIVVVNGRLRLRERRGAVPGEETPLEFSVSVNDVQRFERHMPPPEPAGWHVTVSTRDHVDALAQLLDESPGLVPLVFHISGQSKRSSRGIANAPYVRAQLEKIVGPANVRAGMPGL